MIRTAHSPAVRLLRRPVAVVAKTALLALAAAGCTEMADSPDVGAPMIAEPRNGGRFTMMLEAPGTLEPGLVDDVYESCIMNQIHDGLLEFDTNLNPVPAIAREWSVSRDGREYVFSLRPDARFHNGRPVTAHDFVYTFTRIFAPGRVDHGLGGEYLSKILGVTDDCDQEAESIAGLVAVNDSTLKIVLEAPYGSFLSALAMDQTKVIAHEEVERWGDEYGLHPVGSGPFVFREYIDDGVAPRIVLAANEDYFNGRPYLDEIVFHVPKDYNIDKGAEWLRSGRLSMCDISGSMRESFQNDVRFKLIRRPELSFSFFGVNQSMEPLSDVRVRRAIAHAINREKFQNLDPAGRIATVGILPPGMFGYSPEPKALAYDPDLARRLLAEAGYPGGKGLAPVEHWQADRGEIGRLADENMKADLAEVGIDIQFTYVEWDEFDERLLAKTLPSYGLTWVADVPDPDSFLASLFATDGVYNLFEYSDPTVDSLLAVGGEMRSSMDRASLYRRAEKIILNDVPVIPLYHIANNYAVQVEVKDMSITPFGLGGLPLDKVWIDAPAS